MATVSMVNVKLVSPRCGNVLDPHGRVAGVFAQAAGDVVAMSSEEAQRNIDKGLAVLVETKKG